jgi:hypothetical protein
MYPPHTLLRCPRPPARRYGFPFDRHDWFVDRAGREVHYVIDYYYCAAPGADVAGPGVGGLAPAHTKSIHVDVRPAVDTLAAVVDRLRRFPARAAEALARPRFRAEGLDPANAPAEAAAFALHADAAPAPGQAAARPSSSSAAVDVCPVMPRGGAGAAAGGGEQPAAAAAGPARGPPAAAAGDDGGDAVFRAMHDRCGPLLERLKAAPESARPDAHVAFNYCMGTVLCPAEAGAFMKALDGRSAADGAAAGAAAGAAGGADLHAQEKEAAAFETMTQCVFGAMQKRRGANSGGGAAATAGAAPAASGGTAPLR